MKLDVTYRETSLPRLTNAKTVDFMTEEAATGTVEFLYGGGIRLAIGPSQNYMRQESIKELIDLLQEVAEELDRRQAPTPSLTPAGGRGEC